MQGATCAQSLRICAAVMQCNGVDPEGRLQATLPRPGSRPTATTRPLALSPSPQVSSSQGVPAN